MCAAIKWHNKQSICIHVHTMHILLVAGRLVLWLNLISFYVLYWFLFKFVGAGRQEGLIRCTACTHSRHAAGRKNVNAIEREMATADMNATHCAPFNEAGVRLVPIVSDVTTESKLAQEQRCKVRIYAPDNILNNLFTDFCWSNSAEYAKSLATILAKSIFIPSYYIEVCVHCTVYMRLECIAQGRHV